MPHILNHTNNSSKITLQYLCHVCVIKTHLTSCTCSSPFWVCPPHFSPSVAHSEGASFFQVTFATITVLWPSRGISHGVIYLSRRANLSSLWQISTQHSSSTNICRLILHPSQKEELFSNNLFQYRVPGVKLIFTNLVSVLSKCISVIHWEGKPLACNFSSLLFKCKQQRKAGQNMLFKNWWFLLVLEMASVYNSL